MIKIEEIFPWNEYFETGLGMIDSQHMKLVELVNQLATHLAYESERLLINRVLDELTSYTVYHFQAEESIWHEFLPSDEMTSEHQQVHNGFIEKIVEFRRKYEASHDAAVAAEIFSFLINWLAFHILDTDKRMAEMVLAVQAGMTIDDAKIHASAKMAGATPLLIQTILKTYDTLSSRTLHLLREITQRQRAEQQLKLFKNAIDSSLEAIFITECDGTIIDANPSFCADVGKEIGDIIGCDICRIKPSLFHDVDSNNIWDAASEQGHWAGEIVSMDSNGTREAAWLSLSSVTDTEGAVSHYTGVLSSASQILERKHSLEIEVNHDLLTTLPNRRLLNDRLDQAMVRGRRSGKMLAICFLDLDGFKRVNDTLGHEAGDKLLCTVSRRLKETVRGEDTVARLGGDEFAILLGELTGIGDVSLILNKVLDRIKTPILIDGEEAKVSASIGVAIYSGEVVLRDELLKRADNAMYDAKRSGKARFKVWGRRM